MASLVKALERFATACGDEVAVVFDGVAPVRSDVVDVAHASEPGPNAADRAIAERVEADADPGTLTVVTSDRALAERVRAAGAAVVGAGAFRERLR